MSKYNPVQLGEVFKKLTVIEELDKKSKNRHRIFLCRCECGTLKEVVGDQLRRGRTSSCGCYTYGKPGEVSWNVSYGIYRYGALKRNYIFLLTLEQFKEICSKNCYYSGHSPRLYNAYKKMDGSVSKRSIKHHRSKEFIERAEILINGIDRKNNSLGYTLDNCVPCCSICNWAKNNLTYDEFILWLNETALYRTQFLSQNP